MAATVSRTPFGEHLGSEVEEVRLANGSGATASIITYGAILKDFCVKDRADEFGDIVLGLDNLQEYVDGNPGFGATIGRTAGRIRDAIVNTDEGEFLLDACDHKGINPRGSLHGGPVGFDKVVWTVTAEISNENGAGVCLRYVSPDGDQGFPGELTVDLTYLLTSRDELVLEYTATSTRDTPCSLTNHSYFNLGGHSLAATGATSGAEGIRGHTLRLDCDEWLVTGTEGEDGPNGNLVAVFDEEYGLSSDGIPTGEERDVAASPHDFREPTLLGGAVDAIAERYPEWPHGDGYVCRNQGMLTCAPVAEVYHPASGRCMSVSSTEPVAQLYFSTLLADKPGKSGVVYGKYGAICVEMQRYADAVKCDTPALTQVKRAYVERRHGSTLLRRGNTYRQRTVYALSVR